MNEWDLKRPHASPKHQPTTLQRAEVANAFESKYNRKRGEGAERGEAMAATSENMATAMAKVCWEIMKAN